MILGDDMAELEQERAKILQLTTEEIERGLDNQIWGSEVSKIARNELERRQAAALLEIYQRNLEAAHALVTETGTLVKQTAKLAAVTSSLAKATWVLAVMTVILVAVTVYNVYFGR